VPYGEFDLWLPCESQTSLWALGLVSLVVRVRRHPPELGAAAHLQRFTYRD